MSTVESEGSKATASEGSSKEEKKAAGFCYAKAAHEQFVLGLDKKTDTFEYYVTEHLRMRYDCRALLSICNESVAVKPPSISCFLLSDARYHTRAESKFRIS